MKHTFSFRFGVIKINSLDKKLHLKGKKLLIYDQDYTLYF